MDYTPLIALLPTGWRAVALSLVSLATALQTTASVLNTVLPTPAPTSLWSRPRRLVNTVALGFGQARPAATQTAQPANVVTPVFGFPVQKPEVKS